MKLSEKTFQVLDALDNQEISTQRELAEHAGVSLGQVNYILKSLLEKGLVKIGNFRKNPRKIGYIYFLTPKGIETKSKLAVNFVLAKLREYDRLRASLLQRLLAIEKEYQQRFVFIGPQKVHDFIESIIQEERLNLIMVKHYFGLNDLVNIELNSFDVILLFDGSEEIKREEETLADSVRDRIIPLW